MAKEKKFFENLKCEELEVIKQKKRTGQNSKRNKIAELVEEEMQEKFCEN